MRVNRMFHSTCTDVPSRTPATRRLALAGPIYATMAHVLANAYSLAFFDRHQFMITRRRFVASASSLAGTALAMPACSAPIDTGAYDTAASRTWRLGALTGLRGDALGRELVRYATMAPSSHNTQCWKFTITDKVVTIIPDLTRRCPAVDPDDHHLFVSLGCATENLIQSALAHGFNGDARFDSALDHVRVTLEPTSAQASPLFKAIAERQCSRSEYDAKPISSEELNLLQRAGTAEGVQLLLMTERSVMDKVLDHVVQANSAQMADASFVKELKSWIRFNGADAVRSGDGLYSGCTGNPSIPTWIGNLAFSSFFSTKGENEKIVRQIRSSSGVAVFVGDASDKAHWVNVGRCYQRFALQATALGIRNAFLNQPVEVASHRSNFAAAIGVPGHRPDLLVRFGRGPLMPRSLRRPVNSVLV